MGPVPICSVGKCSFPSDFSVTCQWKYSIIIRSRGLKSARVVQSFASVLFKVSVFLFFSPRKSPPKNYALLKLPFKSLHFCDCEVGKKKKNKKARSASSKGCLSKASVAPSHPWNCWICMRGGGGWVVGVVSNPSPPSAAPLWPGDCGTPSLYCFHSAYLCRILNFSSVVPLLSRGLRFSQSAPPLLDEGWGGGGG